MKRTQITAGLIALLLTSTAAACVTAQRTAAEDNVGIGTAVVMTRSTAATDTTYSTVVAPTGFVVACDTAASEGTNWAEVSVDLAERCDYRVTGAACQEDELCAVQQVRDTGDFSHLSATELSFIHGLTSTYVDTATWCVLGVAEVEIAEVRAGHTDWQGASDDAGDALLDPTPSCGGRPLTP
jgi:hypothetical protein